MKVIKRIPEIRLHIKNLRKMGKNIGFVPTMGFLHNGHLSLVKQSCKENDVTGVSIYVNPTQFGPNEDLDRYPRDFSRDEALLDELGVDFIFYPGNKDIYPDGYCTYVDVEGMGEVLCGSSRLNHFRGVTTVVLKLFNILTPDNAYFGRKDAQQAIILKKMVTDLNLDVNVNTIPIVRDTDGLALSSRNVYLSPEQREAALFLPRALQNAKEKIHAGLTGASTIRTFIVDEIKKSPHIEIDYVEVVSLDKLEKYPGPDSTININNTLIAAAVKVGKTRLIDNFTLGEI
ncbi:MAG: pantoate--beta-alanine ligase [bacterium]|nr:pantoate--beta-alanine ligase [bacterium]